MDATLDSVDTVTVKFRIPLVIQGMDFSVDFALPRFLWEKSGKPVDLSIDFYAEGGARLVVWGEAVPFAASPPAEIPAPSDRTTPTASPDPGFTYH